MKAPLTKIKPCMDNMDILCKDDYEPLGKDDSKGESPKKKKTTTVFLL